MVDCPNIYVDALPQAERENASAISNNLRSLCSTLEQLSSALALFDHSRSLFIPFAENQQEDLIWERVNKNRLLLSWERIAVKSGAISIFEFRKVCDEIDRLRETCPTLNSYTDLKAHEDAEAHFKLHFPHYYGLRHFAAHGAEMFMRPDQYERHKADDLNIPGVINVSNSTGVIVENIADRTYTNTFEGNPISYELSDETVSRFEEAVSLRLSMFQEIAEITVAYAAPDKRENPVPHK